MGVKAFVSNGLFFFSQHSTPLGMPSFLGAFAKLRETTISFVISVRPTVRVEKLDSHYTDFHKILYLTIFRKSVKKIRVSLKFDDNNEQFT
jgi:hypothetical protein